MKSSHGDRHLGMGACFHDWFMTGPCCCDSYGKGWLICYKSHISAAYNCDEKLGFCCFLLQSVITLHQKF